MPVLKLIDTGYNVTGVEMVILQCEQLNRFIHGCWLLYLSKLNERWFMSGLTDKISGKAKQAAGSATGDDKLKNEGKLEEVKGTLKDKFDQAVDTVSDKIDEAKQKHESEKK